MPDRQRDRKNAFKPPEKANVNWSNVIGPGQQRGSSSNPVLLAQFICEARHNSFQPSCLSKKMNANHAASLVPLLPSFPESLMDMMWLSWNICLQSHPKVAD